MDIRKAKPSDLEEVYKLFLEMLASEDKAAKKAGISLIRMKRDDRSFEKNAKKELLKEIKKKDGIYLVAEDKGKLVAYAYGFLVTSVDPFFKAPKTGYFSALLVTKKYRGKGIGKTLYKQLEDWFNKKKCDLLVLEVFLENPALRLYEKWKYKPGMCKMFKKL
ncbi:GNAT family N-acetyltransferase [Candidatus Woesearchaeota archaeon]|nr:GNAT family N-acetyltransferase [Candidatus Woesearchaeota archaeon]MBW3014145.1 GNAT family N-acetyltransferase [Candidatus Woesearchaeota archaeon]